MKIIELTLKNRLLRYLVLVVTLYVILSIVVTFQTLSFLSLMLGWNVILAVIPVILAFIFLKKSEEDNIQTLDKVILVFLFLLWLFFFPNAFYIITDFIHLGGEEFYYFEHRYSPTVYTENFLGYLLLTHIFLGAYIGVFMANYSLKMIEQFFIKNFGNIYSTMIVIGIVFLSSIGIYIGRFLRFNSWDIINPFNIIKELLVSVNMFTVQFIIIFMIIQLSLYYLLKPFIRVDNI